jgi:hypothetical protein
MAWFGSMGSGRQGEGLTDNGIMKKTSALNYQ